jgi:hypothetical protein
MAELLKKLETILVVDDVSSVRDLVVGILQRANYTVLRADGGADALKLVADYPGKIDLLLSDVEMPGMTGPNLGDELKKARPEIHVMFMSGFTGGNLLVLNYGWSFIEKPFVPTKLLQMVQEVLAKPNKSQSGHKFDTRQDTDPNKKLEEGQVPPIEGK